MDEEKKFADSLKAAAPYATLGIQLAITIGVFCAAGYYADGYFGTKPWIMIAAVTVGCIGAMIKFIRTAAELTSREDRERHSAP